MTAQQLQFSGVTGIRAFQVIDRVIRNNDPLFLRARTDLQPPDIVRKLATLAQALTLQPNGGDRKSDDYQSALTMSQQIPSRP
jgi:hypothetical protein